MLSPIRAITSSMPSDKFTLTKVMHRRSGKNNTMRNSAPLIGINTISTTLLLATSSALLSACVSVPVINDLPASTQIDPIPQPNWSVGMKREMVDVRDGQQKGYEITELLPEGKLRGKSLESSKDEPCSWTGSIEWFAPAESWQNCGNGEWKSGTNAVKLISGGSLWPLKAGARAEYRRTPTSSLGNKGTPETRKCEVIGPVAVSLSHAELDAIKVQCNTRRWDGAIESRIWYWTEQYGEIKYMRVHSSEGVKDSNEIVALP